MDVNLRPPQKPTNPLIPSPPHLQVYPYRPQAPTPKPQALSNLPSPTKITYKQGAWNASILATKKQCLRVLLLCLLATGFTFWLIKTGRGVWWFGDSSVTLNYAVLFSWPILGLIASTRCLLLMIKHQKFTTKPKPNS